MKKLIIALLLIVLCFPAYADTEISGNISNQEWTISGSPYILNGVCTVDVGTSLYIGPGVEVRGNPDGNITVRGSIFADGNEANPILMTENQAGQRWCGILISEEDPEGIFHYVTIEKSHTNDIRWHGGGLNMHGGYLELAYCTFRDNYSEYNSGAIYTYLADYEVHHCVFYNNSCINVAAVWGSDVGCSGNFHHNLMYDNFSPSRGAIYLSSGDHHIDHCTMVNNGTNGDYPDVWGDAQITNSIIWNPNHYGPLTTGIRSIAYSTISQGFEDNPTISNENPLFVDMYGHDYHLQAESPCINAGDPEYPTDLDGSVTDHGAFPFVGEVTPGDFHLTIPELPVIAGHGSFIPIISTFETEFEIFSVEGSILLPEGLGEGVASVEIVEGGPLEQWGESNFEFNVIDDTLFFAAAGASALTSDGPLFQVGAVIPSYWPTGDYAITWLDAACNEGIPEATYQYGMLHVVNPPIGDVSINGTVQAYDASLLLQYLLEEIELTEVQQEMGEVSGDGNLTVEDAGLILQYVANSIDEFPVNAGYYVPYVERPEIVGEYLIENSRISLPIPVSEYEKINSIQIEYTFDKSLFSLVDIVEDDPGRQSTYYKETENGITLYMITGEAFTDNEDIAVSLDFLVDGSAFDGETIHVDEITYNCYSDFKDVGDYVVTETSVDDPAGNIPQTSKLSAIYPNPFNAMTTIRFTLGNSEKVQISVFNTMGQKIATLLETSLSQGEHEISWNAENVSSGTYFLKCDLGDKNYVRRISLIR